MATLLYNSNFDIEIGAVTPEDIMQFVAKGQDVSDFLIVLPTGRQVYELERRFIRDYFDKTGKPVKTPLVHTIQTLAKNLLGELYPEKRPVQISDAYRLALFEEAIKLADVEYFQPKKGKISHGVIERIERIIMGIKEDGITPAKLLADLAQEDNEDVTDRQKLADIEKIYSKYQDLLGAKYIDSVELLIKVCNAEAFRTPDLQIDPLSGETQLELNFNTEPLPDENNLLNKLFADKKLILFFGFTEFKTYEAKFVSLFAKTTIPVLINLDYNTKNGPLFANLEDPITTFTALYNRQDCYLDTSEFATEEMAVSDYLRRWLFNEESNKQNKRLREMLQIFACNNRKEEVKAISKYIRYLVEKEGYLPEDIAIATRKPEKYSPLFREFFYMDSVPFDMSDRFALKASPITSAIFVVFDLFTKHFRLSDVHKAMKNRYLGFIKGDEPLDPDNLLKVANKLRISGGHYQGGRNFWLSRFDANIKYWEGYIEKEAGSFDDWELDSLKNELRETQKAQSDFNDFCSAFNINLKDNIRPSEFKKIIVDEIINKFDINKTIEDDYENLLHRREKIIGNENDYLLLHDNIEKDVRALKQFNKLIDEFVYVLEDRYPDEKYNPLDLIKRLSIAVEGDKFQIREKRGFGVTVTSTEQLRGMSYKVLILCGAIDGEFPMNYSTDKFLGKELPDSEKKQLKSERMQFYQFLTSNKEAIDDTSPDQKNPYKIIITYPKADGGKELMSSSFLHSLLNISVEKKEIFPTKDELKENPDVRFIKDIDFRYSDEGLFPWLYSISNRAELIVALANDKLKGNAEGVWASPIAKDILKDEFVDLLIQSLVNIEQTEKSPQFFDTGLLTEKAKEILERLEIDKKVYSVSEMEVYAKCPYQYYAQRLLNLQLEKVDEDDILAPMEKGSLLHNILYVFFRKLQEKTDNVTWLSIKNITDLPLIRPVTLDPSKKEDYSKLLKSIATEQYKDYYLDNTFLKIEYENIVGNIEDGGTLKGSLDTWLEGELERCKHVDSHFFPSAFEFSFGSSGKDGQIKPVEINGVKFKGKIDRIEFSDKNDCNHFVIADYKTGYSSMMANKDIISGKALQIPVYALALETILRDYYEYDVSTAGGIYYSLVPKIDKEKLKYLQLLMFNSELDFPDKGGYRKGSASLVKDEEMLRSEYLDSSKDYVKRYAENIAAHIFDPKPIDAKSCEYCGLLSLCRFKR